tara:strand:- start:451 stop:1167 length:717 start_codon:yes stop_codon:yes gene_type:complete
MREISQTLTVTESESAQRLLWQPKRLHEEEGLILKLTPHSEKGQVAQVFFAHNGIRAVFIGKKSAPQFAAKLDLRNVLCPARAHFSFKIPSETAMPKVGHMEILEGFLSLAKDPIQWGRAAYLLEISEMMLPHAHPETEVYHLLSEALMVLAAGKGDGCLLRAYELRFLAAQGLLAPVSEWANPELVPIAHQLLSAPMLGLPAVSVKMQKQLALPFLKQWRELGFGPTKSAQYLKQFR